MAERYGVETRSGLLPWYVAFPQRSGHQLDWPHKGTFWVVGPFPSRAAAKEYRNAKRAQHARRGEHIRLSLNIRFKVGRWEVLL